MTLFYGIMCGIFKYMTSLSLTFSKVAKNIRVEMNASRFERLAEVFGLYNPQFLKELEAAERDIRSGRTQEISSFRDLER